MEPTSHRAAGRVPAGPPPDRRAVRRRLAERRRRTLRIRKRVALALVVTRLAFFAVISIQMALGRDPTLGSFQKPAIVGSKGAAASVTTSHNRHAAPRHREIVAARRHRAALRRERKRAAARRRAEAR